MADGILYKYFSMVTELTATYCNPLMPVCLTADDCFELGRMAYNQGDWYHSITWMGQALHLIDTESNPSADKALALDYLAYSTYMVGLCDMSLETLSWQLWCFALLCFCWIELKVMANTSCSVHVLIFITF